MPKKDFGNTSCLASSNPHPSVELVLIIYKTEDIAIYMAGAITIIQPIYHLRFAAFHVVDPLAFSHFSHP